MVNETKKKEIPPYVAFSTFLSFIKGLAKTGMPSRIDKSLLRNMSGSNQSSIISALKWFDLIDDVGAPKQSLDALVKSGDAVGPQLGDMIRGAYVFTRDGTIQLDRATGSQLEEKFRSYGLSGSTVVKAMAFFISACKEAEMPLSTHIKLPKVARPNGSAKAKKGREQGSDDELDGGAPRGQTPVVKPANALMDKFPAFDPNWSEAIQEKWFTAFAKMQEMLKD